MRIFLSAGEASGDAYAAALVDQLRKTAKGFVTREAIILSRAERAIGWSSEELSRLDQNAVDSLDAVELAMALEDEFGINITEEEIGAIRTLPALVDHLHRRPDVHVELVTPFSFEFEGIGGPRLAAAIGNLIADSSTWGAISISQSLKIAPRAYKGFLKAKKRLAAGPPGMLVAIDFGFFNVRLCRAAKKRGWKVLYFMPPSSWRRDKQGKDLAAITDAVVTPFPWSADILRANGIDAFFFGHPIKQLTRAVGARRALPEEDGPEGKARLAPTIAVLPGSRAAELEANLPLIAEVLRPLATRVEFAVAPNLKVDEVRSDWNRLAPNRNDTFAQGDVYSVLDRARAAIVCSGTATLEAALMRCPHVVVYRITPSMERERKLIRFKRPKYIALPNIILDRDLVPELAGLEINPSEVRAALEPLLEPGPEREDQLRGFREIEEILGPDDAITQTAELAIRLVRE